MVEAPAADNDPESSAKTGTTEDSDTPYSADSNHNPDESSAADVGLDVENEVDQPQRTPQQENQSRGDFPCLESACGAVFKRVGELNQHRQNVHPKGRFFPCEMCNKSYKTRSHLAEHIEKSKTHKLRLAGSIGPSAMPEPQNARVYPGLRKDPEPRGTYVCSHDGCGKVFDLASRCRRHEQTSHMK